VDNVALHHLLAVSRTKIVARPRGPHVLQPVHPRATGQRNNETVFHPFRHDRSRVRLA